MVFSTYKKQRILHFAFMELRPPTIARVAKGEAKVLESRCLQVPKTLLRNWFDREKSWIGKTIESNG